MCSAGRRGDFSYPCLWVTWHGSTSSAEISGTGWCPKLAVQADFAQMIKIYGDYGQHDAAGRYSPSPMIETIIKIRDGRPDPRHISTSYIERQNLTIRMAIRRFTRLTNAFSKKLDNHKAACALHLRVLQFLPDTHEPSCDSRDGSRNHRSHLDDSGTAGLSPVDILPAIRGI